MKNELKVENIYGDGIGYVAILDVMGDDFTPAEDARTSTNKGRLGPEKDAKLQERLVKDRHTSPFEGVVIKAEFVVPLFVLREMDRHRTITKISDEDVEILSPEESCRKWFARNEMSGRYVQMPNEYYHPVEVRGQSTTNKQGGSADVSPVSLEVQESFKRRGAALTRQARELYDFAVAQGVEKGIARIYNTQNQYTKIRITGSLKNMLDFLKLRLPNVVLWECRRVAEELHNMLRTLFPSIIDQWERNVYDTVTLDRDEVQAVRGILEIFSFDNLDVQIAQIKSAMGKLGVERGEG